MPKIGKDSRILVTGGTGSFGKAFVKSLFSKFPDIERVVIFSRDELKQWEMQQEFPADKFPQLRFFLGDIRDSERIKRALERINVVVHAAALKQVPAAEYNPMEFIKTNVLGAENLVQACLDTGVRSLIALSTDKAAAPINLYGATKLCSDKLFIAANNIKGSKDLKLSVVRYGNVMGSRGSVIPFFMKMAKASNQDIPVTDLRMTRFNILLSEGVDMVLWALENALGGEIFVPKIPSYRLSDVVQALVPNQHIKIIGMRPGEKMHEEMITSSDSYSTIDLGKYYAILPGDGVLLKTYLSNVKNCSSVSPGFAYNSETNPHFLSVEELRSLVRNNLDSSFSPL